MELSEYLMQWKKGTRPKVKDESMICFFFFCHAQVNVFGTYDFVTIWLGGIHKWRLLFSWNDPKSFTIFLYLRVTLGQDRPLSVQPHSPAY